MNKKFPLADLLRQSVYSRLAGYEDLNDAVRVSADPTFRLIGSKKNWDRGAALTLRLQSFEAGMLASEEDLLGLMAVNRELISQAEAQDEPAPSTCERTDEPWSLPAEVMCRVQREKTAYSGQRGCILWPCQGQTGNPSSTGPRSLGPVNVAVNQIRLTPSAVARALGVVTVLLVLASIAGQLTNYLLGHDRVPKLVLFLSSFFYVDAEQNLPTLFSALLMFCAALLLTVITVLKKKYKDPDVSKWAILVVGFLSMTVDEVCSLHEKLIRPMRELLGTDTLGIFYFAWVIPGLAVVFILALFFLRFLLRLSTNTRLTFIVAATLFLGGSLGLELVGGSYAELHGRNNLTFTMIATVEESLEMAGMIVFIYGLLKEIADNYKEVLFRLDTFE